MSAEIGRETTTYSPFPTKNVSAIAPAKTTYDWSNTVTWTVSNTAWLTTKNPYHNNGTINSLYFHAVFSMARRAFKLVLTVEVGKTTLTCKRNDRADDEC